MRRSAVPGSPTHVDLPRPLRLRYCRQGSGHAHFRPTARAPTSVQRGGASGAGSGVLVYKDKVEGIVRFGTRRVPTTAEIEDLVQEIFTKAFAPRARRTFDGQRPYGPYLFAIARNALRSWCHDMMREVPTDWPALCEWLEGVEATEQPTHADPRVIMAVERFVRTLSPELQAVHQQRFVRGLSQRDAAAALGLGRQSVRTLEGQLRDQLRSALAAEGVEGDGSNAATSEERMGQTAGPVVRRGEGMPS